MNGQQPPLQSGRMRLDSWMASQDGTQFPRTSGVGYATRFATVSEYLNKEVHPHVEKGALLNGAGYLTDHGPGHIETLIQRLSDLVLLKPQPIVSAYEAYLLLMAAHLHDVGNIYGREGHEAKLHAVITKIQPMIVEDSAELRAIQQIAGAHGGRIKGDKNTIGRLPVTDPVMGHTVRWQFLAALLRLADELSDDSARADRFGLDSNTVAKGSQVYHRYAQSLHSVCVKPEDAGIDLHFDLARDLACQLFGKRDSEVYLLDEIFERTVKTYLECCYCMRFCRGTLLRLDSVNVTIKVYESMTSIQPAIDPIAYRLQETGYPNEEGITFAGLCPDVTWTGVTLRARLSGSETLP